ncbi:hypothetical protein Clacol_009358 [Clathrus columnatus]|uniref:Uncharacterized protein n=1 Tax=Clathrus columnatus TaxID=1419009 RepID=A0AAV5APW4_9AGAM|nr:hypothetical protein Clacol_009358 [Clathrus columnatus]
MYKSHHGCAHLQNDPERAEEPRERMIDQAGMNPLKMFVYTLIQFLSANEEAMCLGKMLLTPPKKTRISYIYPSPCGQNIFQQPL